MAKWDFSKLKEPVVPDCPAPVLIQASEFFRTPTNMEDLQDFIGTFNGGERTAAMVSAMMAWNLACSIVNGTSEEMDTTLEVKE